MVHLQSVLGLEATGIILRGMSDLVNLPVAVLLLDTDDRDRLVTYVRPESTIDGPPRFTNFCRYLHDSVPGGLELCQACDVRRGWQILDEEWTEARMYQCHMGLCEFGMAVKAGGDLCDPIVWGQARLPEAPINDRINNLRERVAQLDRAEAEKITDEHVRELRELIPTIREVKEDEIGDLCRRLTSGTRGLERLLQTEYHMGRMIHRIKSSLTLSRGGMDRVIAGITRAGVFGYVLPEDLRKGLRERCRRIEEGIEGATRAMDLFERSRRMVHEEERPLSFRWHPVRTLGEQAARRIRAEAAERHIEVRMHGPTLNAPKNSYILVDWDSMMELFDLVLDNALKYSWSGSEQRTRSIDINWQIRRDTPDNLPAGQAPGDDVPWLEVSIESFGLQIHPEDRDIIFDAGGRGQLFDRRRPILGAGMGLHIALGILRQHDGYINIWCHLFDQPDLLVQRPDGRLEAPPGKIVATLGLPAERCREEKPR